MKKGLQSNRIRFFSDFQSLFQKLIELKERLTLFNVTGKLLDLTKLSRI
jgi:hypothetical protein